MLRRNLLERAGAALLTGTALAGCLGSDTPPPRKSEVIDSVSVAETELRVAAAADPWIASRADIGTSGALAAASPIGTASAKGRGGSSSGATGRGSGGYSSAPRFGGRAWYGAHGDDDEWYEDHEDEVDRYDAEIARFGVGYLGTNGGDDLPDPGPVSWDSTYDGSRESFAYDFSSKGGGWYRVGAEVVAANADHRFGWESVDVEIDPATDGYQIDEEWKVSPRI